MPASQKVCQCCEMGRVRRVAPILAARDLDAMAAHYRRLGFLVRHAEESGYAYATRDGVEIHLGAVNDDSHARSPCSAYLWVDDADALAAEWRSAGVEVHGPEDTTWGQHEGAVVDPDGNVIRFGSPIATKDPPVTAD